MVVLGCFVMQQDTTSICGGQSRVLDISQNPAQGTPLPCAGQDSALRSAPSPLPDLDFWLIYVFLDCHLFKFWVR